jgi:hypothetical protein
MLYGALAGAAGSAVLDVTTYADMAIRGRAPSELPQKMVKEISQRAHVPPFDKPDEQLTENDKHRETAFGALLGYADGLGVGAMYGAMRPAMRNVSWFWTGIGLAAVTLLLSEGTATALKQTDPRKWGPAAWIADLVPRFAYGWTTALTFDSLAKERQ